MEKRIDYLKVIPKCDIKFVEELLDLLGEPSFVKFYFHSKESEETIKKIATLVGITNPHVDQTLINGKVSKERALDFYKQGLGFRIRDYFVSEITDPRITLVEMEWIKLGEYSISFDCYSIRARFYSETNLSKKLFELLDKHKVKFSYEYITEEKV
jgi:hypothetical protein